jgi:dTDP-4-amino-4,6-dideoxyglucose
MKATLSTLAAFGGTPALSAPLHVGQLNLPALAALEVELRRLFDGGSLSAMRDLEERLAQTLGVEDVVCATNGTVALMMLAAALGLTGEVIVPAFTFAATAQSMSWAGVEPVLCDVDKTTQMLSADLVRPLITERTSAILGVHVWGHACAPGALMALANARSIPVFFDACHALGCMLEGRPAAQHGVASVFSLHATKIVNSAEGGCIATADATLAATLRQMRDTYLRADQPLACLSLRARMSNIQSILGLLSLRDLPINIEENRRRYNAYREGLDGVPGIALLHHGDGNNYQYIVAEVDADVCGLTRDQLIALLERENVICRRHFFPGLHRLPPYEFEVRTNTRGFPNTEYLAARSIQFPSGQAVSTEDVTRICERIRAIVMLSSDIRRAKREA